MRRLITQWFHVSPREFGVVLLCGLLLLACALAYVWPNVKMVNLAYEFQEQKRRHQELIQENSLLKLERDSLRSLDRIQFLAETQIGMKEARPEQVVTVVVR
ncbi:MAG: hypothetical protein GWN57_12160 [Nitrospinaceae bacterium]|nr:hypothetical protein [Nitrospinaceae bacterium]